MSDLNRWTKSFSAAVIVAHPDDETLWCGGTILAHPEWDWFVMTLCRGEDADRAPRFRQVLEQYGAEGVMANLEDGPEQTPLADADVEKMVFSLLPYTDFDVIYTHGPFGEYTRHLRHEETSRAVSALWLRGDISCGTLCMFAYEDGNKRYLPRPEKRAHIREPLSDEIWHEKYRLITEYYGFQPDSFEARTTPHEESFWSFLNREAFQRWNTSITRRKAK